jgi:hypothetical protein
MFAVLAVLCSADPGGFTVTNRCPAFVVENKVPAKAAPVYPTGYPLRGSWWTGCPDWTHLTRGEHAGKFPADWLRTLSAAEVQSLHSDDHEGRVQWGYVPGRPPVVKQSAPVFCPPGGR